MTRSLFLERDFARVWWSGLVSNIGNGALFIALPVQVYHQTASPLITALTLVAGALPGVLVSQWAGVWVDRLKYRTVLVWANLLMALVTLAFLLTPGSPWWVTALVSFISSSVAQFLGPAENALLPALVGKEHVGEAASLNALGHNLSRLIGPALGGLLLTHAGFAVVIIADVLTYLLAALLVLGVRDIEPTTPQDRPSVLSEWRQGLRVVHSHHLLRTVVIIGSLVAFGEGFISTLMAPFVKEVLRGTGETLGWIMSVQAVGGLLGAWLMRHYADRVPDLNLLTLGAWGSGLLLLLYFNYALVYPLVWPALLITAIAGVPFAMFGTAQTIALQRNAPQFAIGRVFSTAYGLMGLLGLLGMGVSGWLAERLGPLVINVDAGMYLAAGVVGVLAVYRNSKGDQSKEN